MTDMLATGATWFESMRVQFMTVPVAYCRDTATVQAAATIGRTVFEVARDYGVFEKIESRDYIIAAGELLLNDEPVLPARGDQIRETRDGTTYVYEVMAPGNEPCWRWSDSYRRSLRIHTKQIGEE